MTFPLLCWYVCNGQQVVSKLAKELTLDFGMLVENCNSTPSSPSPPFPFLPPFSPFPSLLLLLLLSLAFPPSPLLSTPSLLPSLNNCRRPNRNHLRRLDTQLTLWVMEARNLQSKKKYFCEIYLNGILYAQTCCKVMQDILFWGEPFIFE